jgi:hypothetical protein
MKRRTRLICESLESRVVLSPLFLDGTIGPDTIVVSSVGGLITATINGFPISQSEADVDSIVINAFAGFDQIDIESNFDNPITINGHAGDDLVRVAPTSGNLVLLGTNVADITIDGGADNDRVIIADHHVGVPESYVFDGINFRVGDPLLPSVSAQVERIDLLATSGENLIDVQATTPTTAINIDAGGGNDTFLIASTPAGVLSAIQGNVTLHGGSGDDILNMADVNNLAPAVYSFNSLIITATGAAPIQHSAIEDYVVQTGQGNNTINVESTPIGAYLGVFGGAGADTFNVTPAFKNLDFLGSVLEIDGGNGIDQIVADDSANALATRDYRFRSHSISFRPSLLDIVLSDTEHVHFLASNAPNFTRIILDTFDSNLTYDAGGGGDNTVVEFDTAGAAVANTLLVDGGSGDDEVRLDDHLNPFTDSYSITDTLITRSALAGITYFDNESIVVECGMAKNLIDVHTALPATTRILAGGGDDQIIVRKNHQDHPLELDGGPGIDDLTVDGALGSGPILSTNVLLIGPSQDLGDVTLGGLQGYVQVSSLTSHISMTSLNVPFLALFDLNRATAVIDYSGPSPINSIDGAITDAYGSGSWTVTVGITSTAARTTPGTGIGFAEATDLFTTFPATFEGIPIDDTTVIVRWTLYGDANLNRQVNINDFAFLAANFNQSPRRWARGDFNYDNVNNITDFARLAANFNQTVTAATPRPAATTASAAGLGLGGGIERIFSAVLI